MVSDVVQFVDVQFFLISSSLGFVFGAYTVTRVAVEGFQKSIVTRNRKLPRVLQLCSAANKPCMTFDLRHVSADGTNYRYIGRRRVIKILRAVRKPSFRYLTSHLQILVWCPSCFHTRCLTSPCCLLYTIFGIPASKKPNNTDLLILPSLGLVILTFFKPSSLDLYATSGAY